MSKKNILVTSYPKSGATWFRFLMYVSRYGKLEKSIDVRRYYPQISEKHIIERRLKDKDHLFIKSHYPYMEEIPYLDKIDQCIYIVRNPFDILMSLLNHYIIEGVQNVETEEGRLKFFRKMIKSADRRSYEINPNHAAGGWNNHVLSWINRNPNIPVYLIKYEHLREDAYKVISRMNRDLQLGFSDHNIKISSELTGFAEMKKMENEEIKNKIHGMFFSEKRLQALEEKKGQFINKGKVGNYKDNLPKNLINLAKRSYKEGLKLMGYHMDGKNNIIY